MKKLICLVFAGMLFVGCSADGPTGVIQNNSTISEEAVPEISIMSGDVNVPVVSAKTRWGNTFYDRKPVVDQYMDDKGVIPAYLPKGSVVSIDFCGAMPEAVLLQKIFVGEDGTIFYSEYYMEIELVFNEDNKTYEFIYGSESMLITEDQQQIGPDALLSGYCLTCSWQEDQYVADYGFLLDEDGTLLSMDEALWQEATAPQTSGLADVWIETEYEVYPTGTTKVAVKWYNTSDEQMLFGEGLQLEKEVAGVWRVVEKRTDSNYGWNSIGLLLDGHEQRWHEYWLEPFTYGLTEGHYRISTGFSQETLAGEPIDTRPYPSYHVYGDFYVSEDAVPREMTNLYEGYIEYRHEVFGAVVYLPESWAGFEVFEEAPDTSHESHGLFSALDPNYSRLVIRHPEWQELQPYQDIVFTIINRYAWNLNAEAAVGGDFNLLPERLDGGNNQYMLVKDDADYDESFEGYESILEILANNLHW